MHNGGAGYWPACAATSGLEKVIDGEPSRFSSHSTSRYMKVQFLAVALAALSLVSASRLASKHQGSNIRRFA